MSIIQQQLNHSFFDAALALQTRSVVPRFRPPAGKSRFGVRVRVGCWLEMFMFTAYALARASLWLCMDDGYHWHWTGWSRIVSFWRMGQLIIFSFYFIHFDELRQINGAKA